MLYHSRVPGSTVIGETILRGGVTKSRATTKIVGGVPIKIRSRVQDLLKVEKNIQ